MEQKNVNQNKMRKPSVKPYDYQEKALEKLQEERANGNDSGLLVMATGTGKTITSAFDTKQLEADKVLFLAHQKEIVEQSRREYEKVYGDNLDSGMFYGDNREPEADFVFATRQTLHKEENLKTFKQDEFDYIIIDEHHHALSNTYQDILDYFNPEFLLGLTATPYLVEVDEEDLLENLGLEKPTFRYDIDDATENGDLVEFEAYIYKDNIDYEEAPEDLSEKDLNRKLFMPERNKYIASKWLKEADGRKTIAFCRSIKHAERTALHFSEKGVKARAVHSDMSENKRDSRIEMFREGDLDVLTGVDVFNEGVDFPEVSCLVFMRPTMSDRIFYQQLGRGLRQFKGKDKCVVLDFVNETDWDRLEWYGADRSKTEYQSGKCQECGKDSSKLLEDENVELVCRECRTDDFRIQTGIGEVEVNVEALFDIAEQYQTYRFNKDGYSKEELIEKLQELAEELGTTPTFRECDKSDITPSPASYENNFGSWNNALEKAGLKLNNQHYEKKELIEKLQELADKLGTTPSTTECKKSDITPSPASYENNFGSWNNALEKAGLEVNKESPYYGKKELIEKLQELADKLGTTPSASECDKSDITPSSTSYNRKFGSWNNALEEAGLEINSAHSHSKEDLIEKLQELTEELGTTPSITECRKSDITPTEKPYRNNFGSWSEAKRIAKRCIKEDLEPEEVLKDEGYDVEGSTEEETDEDPSEEPGSSYKVKRLENLDSQQGVVCVECENGKYLDNQYSVKEHRQKTSHNQFVSVNQIPDNWDKESYAGSIVEKVEVDE